MSPWQDSNLRPSGTDVQQPLMMLYQLSYTAGKYNTDLLAPPSRIAALFHRCCIEYKFLSNLTSVSAGKTTLTSFGSGSSIVSLSQPIPALGWIFCIVPVSQRTLSSHCCGRCRIRTCDVIAERTIMIHIIKFCALPSSTRPTFQVYRVLC